MLYRGRYVPEKRPIIGSAYVPIRSSVSYSNEELFAQDLILGDGAKKQSFLSWFFGKMLRV